MVVVYIDYGTATEEIARFVDEDVYLDCYPHLQTYADNQGGQLIETIKDKDYEQCN